MYVFKHALVRDTAYESLPKKARREVHARIADALERLFPEVVEARPELLSLHRAAAEQKRQAIAYAQKAAAAALTRSAFAEATAHIQRALSYLDAIDDARERDEVELALNGLSISALMLTRGWADAEIKRVVDRSHALIDALGDIDVVIHRRLPLALAVEALAVAHRLERLDDLLVGILLRLGPRLRIRGAPRVVLRLPLGLLLSEDGRLLEAPHRDHRLPLGA